MSTPFVGVVLWSPVLRLLHSCLLLMATKAAVCLAAPLSFVLLLVRQPGDSTLNKNPQSAEGTRRMLRAHPRKSENLTDRMRLVYSPLQESASSAMSLKHDSSVPLLLAAGGMCIDQGLDID